MIQTSNGWPDNKSHPFQGMKRKRLCTNLLHCNGPVYSERFHNYCNLRPLPELFLSNSIITGKDFPLTRRCNSLDYDEIMTIV